LKLDCIITTLFISLLIACNHNIAVTGKWELIGSRNNVGDLTLSKDSTFFINGSHSKTESALNGFYNEDKKGTWSKKDNKYLVLYLNQDRLRAKTMFKILSLSKKEMTIIAQEGGDTLNYSRK
jgi:hypothetical protein